MKFSIGAVSGSSFSVNGFGDEYTMVNDVTIAGAFVPVGETLSLGDVVGGVIIAESKIDGNVTYTIQSDDPMEMWIGFENCEISESSNITVSYWGDDTNNPTELIRMNLRQYIEECENVEAYGEFISKKLAEKMATA